MNYNVFSSLSLKAESTPDSPTIAYETYRKQTVLFVQQDYQLDEWVTVNHMAVPFVICICHLDLRKAL